MDMQKMLKQARKMQAQLAEVQDGLKEVTVEATAGGGMIKAVMTGEGDLVSITIDPSAVDTRGRRAAPGHDRGRRERGEPQRPRAC